MTADQVVAIISAVGAVVVTVATYLTSKDYGRTVRALNEPAKLALNNARQGFAQTQGLMAAFLEGQEHRLESMNNELVRVRSGVERLLERLGGT